MTEKKSNTKEKKENFVGDTIKKVVSIGIGAAFMTEESVKKILDDLPLPSDVVTGLLSNAKKSKEEFIVSVREEVGNYLKNVDPKTLVDYVLENYDVNITFNKKMTNKIEQNYRRVLEDIKDPSKIVAVSKYSKYEDVKFLYQLGHHDFGENRIDDFELKANQAYDDMLVNIRWHFIGNIQSNKIPRIASAKNLVAVHSIDSLKHFKLFSKHLDRSCDFYIQVNTSGESQKGGLETIEEITELYNEVKTLPRINVVGLMTMGSIRSDDQLKSAKESFNMLSTMRDEINPSFKLSMGMSADYKIAIESGSDYVRIGSTIFKS